MRCRAAGLCPAAGRAKLFLRLPEEIPVSADPWRNICASDAQFSSLCGAQNLPPNKNNIEINNFSKKEGGDEPFLLLGEFKNVRLSSDGIMRIRIAHPLLRIISSRPTGREKDAYNFSVHLHSKKQEAHHGRFHGNDMLPVSFGRTRAFCNFLR